MTGSCVNAVTQAEMPSGFPLKMLRSWICLPTTLSGFCCISFLKSCRTATSQTCSLFKKPLNQLSFRPLPSHPKRHPETLVGASLSPQMAAATSDRAGGWPNIASPSASMQIPLPPPPLAGETDFPGAPLPDPQQRSLGSPTTVGKQECQSLSRWVGRHWLSTGPRPSHGVSPCQLTWSLRGGLLAGSSSDRAT